MLCIQCQGKPGEHYRVNHIGEIFCNDDCYDVYVNEKENAPNDHEHPYIDDYEAIRSNYIDWLDNFEKDLSNAYAEDNSNVLLKADEMNDAIDEDFENFFDYYMIKGEDGTIAHEIYQYLLKFERLQKKILEWRPKQRDIYYYFSFLLDTDAFDKRIYDTEQIYKLLEQMGEDDLLIELKEHQHPYDSLAFVYEDKEDAERMERILLQKFGNKIDDIGWSEAHLCDGGCGDYEDIYDVNMNDLNSWFFCCSCSEKYLPGFFTKENLLNEIKETETYDLNTESKRDYWYYYIRKIKRSCRYHDIQFPEWIELNYDR